MIKVFMELGQRKRIRVDFEYDRAATTKMRAIAGRRFNGRSSKDKAHWTLPLDLETCRNMRSAFGADIVIGPKLFSWAKNARQMEESLGSIAMADHAPLVLLPAALPHLYECLFLGPKGMQMTLEERQAALGGAGSYQTADVRFMADSPAPLNGNHPGLGKTPETIAAVWEAGLEDGNHLVVAPATAVDGVWEDELALWQKDASKSVGIYVCTGTRPQREKTIEAFRNSVDEVKWLVVNPAMISWRKKKHQELESLKTGKVRKAKPKDFYSACKCDRMHDAHWHYEASYPVFEEYKWTTITVDECHKNSIRNQKSLSSLSLNDLEIQPHGKRIAISGTPMKKKGADLWGILHWLRPDVFTSYWSFADRYFEIEVSEINDKWKKVGGLRKDKEEEFFRALTPYMLRRTKAEALPWLPPKFYIDLWVTMEEYAAQRKMYEQMEEDGVANINGQELATTSILAEFTRLRQFAICPWTMQSGKLRPTGPSNKLAALLQVLEERGVLDNGAEKVIVFSQFREVVEWVAKALTEIGIKTTILSGKENKRGQRKQLMADFQKGDTQVMCIVTTAGGVAVTLDAADTVVFMDEMWSPDETEQAEDRAHRASRNHQVTIIMIRSKDTVDNYVMDTSMDKAEAQKLILDTRRQRKMARIA